ncbi:MAG: DNA repair protein RecN [Deltaproteobacteria bacterium]|nr:DNA repair protein RecN [Deltaproteobacteria bacterium]
MLRELSIKNLAIIDELKISFIEGMAVITGETGAGKSIIVGAIGLLLGDRAFSDIIRSSAENAEVEALFDIGNNASIKEKLTNAGIGANDELVLRRIISRSGKNRVYINGTIATLTHLTSLSESLVNICSQHEHQVLLNAESHIDILDEYAGIMPERYRYGSLFADCQKLQARLAEIERTNRAKKEREDLLAYQLEEIEKSGVVPGEDTALEEEKRVLTHALKLREWSEEAYGILYTRENSIIDRLKEVAGKIKSISAIDGGLGIETARLEGIYYDLDDIATLLRDYGAGKAYDPERLQEIDDRLDLLRSLKRKYGGSIEGILARAEAILQELESISLLERDLSALSVELDRSSRELLEQAEKLSQKRREAAKMLGRAIEVEIRSLDMPGAAFDIRVSEIHKSGAAIDSLTAAGKDLVEFYLSTNVGEALKPLNRIASGGELSRIILAMKKVLARTGSVSTIIFDEVDAGIGGATAEAVGRKLKEVALHHQVICITHLPQIASFGESHFRVAKRVAGDRTTTEVTALAEKERREEIARMLGGVTVTEATRQHASELLKQAREAASGPL